jgi:hypothetical protein
VNPVLAALVVVAATTISVVLVRYVYGEERHRRLPRTKLVMITLWFLASYGVIAFLVIPH